MAASLAFAAFLASATHSERVRLEFSAHQECIAVETFRESVAARLQRVAFAENAPRVLSVRIEKEGDGHRGHLVLRDVAGTVEGERTISAPRSSCEEFGESVALATSIALESGGLDKPLRDAFLVLDPSTIGVDEARARMVAEFLREEMRRLGGDVLDAKTALVCADESCASAAAREAGVEEGVLLRLERLDQQIFVTAVVADARSGLKVRSERARVWSLDQLQKPTRLARAILFGDSPPLRPTHISFSASADAGQWTRRNHTNQSASAHAAIRGTLGLTRVTSLVLRTDAGGYDAVEKPDAPLADETVRYRDEGVSFGIGVAFDGEYGGVTLGVNNIVDLPPAERGPGNVYLPLPMLAMRVGRETGVQGTFQWMNDDVWAGNAGSIGLGFPTGPASRAWIGASMGVTEAGVLVGLRSEIELRRGGVRVRPSLAVGPTPGTSGTTNLWVGGGLAISVEKQKR